MNENNFALVIEDSRSMREFVSLTLQQGAYMRVIEAENPDQALQLLEAQEGTLSLVVSNWNMPGMPLQDFISNIKEQPNSSNAAVLLLTSSNESKAQSMAQKIHADAVLTKPFKAESLLTLVDEHAGIEERRRAKRITPLKKCIIDLGFDDSQPAFVAEVINISKTGILISSPLPLLGAGYIYDFSTLVLQPEDGDSIKLYAQIVRLESDRESVQKGDPKVVMAMDFGRLDETTLNKLRGYISINETIENQQQH